jgi:putative MFS transporter
MRVVSFDSVLERVGYGRFQRRLLVVCGLGWAADAMEVLLVSFALPAMSKEWALSSAQKSMLATAIFFGMLAGAVFWGRISDRIGRRAGFILTIAFDSAFGLLSAFAPSFGWFVVLRVLTGFGVGGTLPVDYGMFSEYLPAKNRSSRLVMLESFWRSGPRCRGSRVARRTALWVARAIRVFRRARHSPFHNPERRSRIAAIPFSRGRGEEAWAVLERVARDNGAVIPEGEREIRRRAARPGHANSSRRNSAARPFCSGSYGFLFDRILRRVYLAASWFRTKGFAMPSVYPNTFIMALAQIPGYFSPHGSSKNGAAGKRSAHTSSRAAYLRGFSRSHPLRRPSSRAPYCSRSSRSGHGERSTRIRRKPTRRKSARPASGPQADGHASPGHRPVNRDAGRGKLARHTARDVRDRIRGAGVAALLLKKDFHREA